MRVVFDRFIVDSDQRRVLDAGAEVRLAPKTFDLLTLLIQERPRAVSKDEILQRVWPNTFVTENNLATLVSDLRTALKDDAREPRLIRTVYGYGYAFVGEVSATGPGEPHADTACLWKLIHEHREIPLRNGVNVLGRSGEGVIVLDSPTISRHHARISISADRVTVEDLGSKNGTWVGTSAVTHPEPLQDGDELRLGSVVVTIRFSAPAPSTETMRLPRS